MQSLIGSRRPHICKQIQTLAEEFGGIDFTALLVLEIKSGGGAEYQTIRGPHDLEEAGPNGGAELLQALMPNGVLFDLNVQLEALGCGPQDTGCRGGGLRPDAVARQNDNAHHEFSPQNCGQSQDDRPYRDTPAPRRGAGRSAAIAQNNRPPKRI